MALTIKLTLSLLSLPLATIKLNGVDTTLNPILGTKKNDKLTASGSSADGITASLAEGKDLVELTAANEFDDEAESNITVKGEDGKDVIQAVDGLLTVTGAIYGNGNADVIEVARATGAVINGGQDDDTLTLGSAVDLNVAGSNATATITDSAVTGADGDDTINILGGATLDGTTVKGDDGKDTIGISSGATLIDSVIAGNEGKDHIRAIGELTTSGSTIYGGKGKDTIEVASAGAMSVDGGMGKDFLRVGSGQTVSGGKGADTFSIESKGGATITDFDAMDEDCFCSDVIQVDGNKLFYDTYEYKATKELFTSASSWAGNIKVKAVAEAVTCNVGTNFTYNASKSATINATAVVKWKATEVRNDLDANQLNNLQMLAALPDPKFPKSGSYFYDSQLNKFSTNGNTPRTAKTVAGDGFGFASVTGFITKISNTANGNLKSRFVAINNLTAYTKTNFEKGDFSFLNLTKKAGDDCDLKQTLVFNKVTQATITNHWASFGVSKKVDSKTLYNLKFGTANFDTVLTGKANLIITKVEDATYVPTPGQYTNSKLTKLTRTANAAAGATITLNLENNFDLYTKRDGFSATANAAYGNYKAVDDNGAVGIKQGVGTAGGFIKYEDITYAGAQSAGLLTHTVATAWDGFVSDRQFTPAMNNNELSFTTTIFKGANGGVNDVQRATGNLIAKIFVQETATANAGNAGLDTWVERAIIPGQVFELTENCSFPSTLVENIAGNGNNDGKYTPAAGGKFGTEYVWTSNGNTIGGYGSPSRSNGCLTVNGAAGSAFACSTNGRGNNLVGNALPGEGFEPYNTGVGAFANLNTGDNQGAFSGSAFNTAVLAKAGMGDNVLGTKEGVPFRILFFDTKGSDNGLYMYSGTANYKGADVTAINTNPTASSAMGTKQTIVKVTGGKGHEIALSDINLV